MLSGRDSVLILIHPDPGRESSFPEDPVGKQVCQVLLGKVDLGKSYQSCRQVEKRMPWMEEAGPFGSTAPGDTGLYLQDPPF